MAQRINRGPKGISRREFMQYTAGTVAVLSAGSLLNSCASSGSPVTREYEQRTYLFNLHHIETAGYDLTLVMGHKEYPLQVITPQVFTEVAQSHPFLGAIGIRHVSHHVYKLDMPKGRHQTCYIRKTNRLTGETSIPFVFTHFPRVIDLNHDSYKTLAQPHMLMKWKRYGIDSSNVNGFLFDDNFKDCTDHACQMISAFPQITSLDPSSASAITTSIIGNQEATYDLAESLTSQGDTWASNRPLMDPITGKQCVDDKGKPMYTLQWSAATSRNAGKAIQASNNTLQNSRSFGIDTTDIASGDAKLRGKVWDYAAGVTYRNPSGRLFKTPQRTSTLISFGTAICGGSAIAAMAPVIKAEGEETGVALATIFTLNSVALILFPPLGHLLGMGQQQFGLWSALAIHDTSSVVGAAAAYGGLALAIGTTVKLTRALWIMPSALLAAWFTKSEGKAKFPLFIIGFIAAAAIKTALPQFEPLWHPLNSIARQSLVVTLFLIGSGLTREVLGKTGIKPLAQGVTLWIIVSVTSATAILVGWIS